MSDNQPKQLGKYQIISQLGKGGMAVVYEGYDPSLNTKRAIKVLNPEHVDDGTAGRTEMLENFRREAQRMAALRHKHIISVVEFGVDDGRPFIVMDKIEGGTLKDRLQLGPLDLDDVKRYVTEIGQALQCAHDAGILHGDIKPSNIIIDRVSGDSYLMDFGIASKLGQGSTDDEKVQLSAYTPAYASPEQLEGRPVGIASDVYSLGVVVYKMCTRELPHPFDRSQDGLEDILRKKAMEDPVPAKSLNPKVPAGLDRELAKVLSADPATRHTTANEFINAVLAALEDDDTARVRSPIPPKPKPKAIVDRDGKTDDESQQPVESARRPVLLMGLLLLLLVGVAGAIYAITRSGGDDTGNTRVEPEPVKPAPAPRKYVPKFDADTGWEPRKRDVRVAIVHRAQGVLAAESSKRRSELERTVRAAGYTIQDIKLDNRPFKLEGVDPWVVFRGFANVDVFYFFEMAGRTQRYKVGKRLTLEHLALRAFSQEGQQGYSTRDLVTLQTPIRHPENGSGDMMLESELPVGAQKVVGAAFERHEALKSITEDIERYHAEMKTEGKVYRVAIVAADTTNDLSRRFYDNLQKSPRLGEGFDLLEASAEVTKEIEKIIRVRRFEKEAEEKTSAPQVAVPDIPGAEVFVLENGHNADRIRQQLESIAGEESKIYIKSVLSKDVASDLWSSVDASKDPFVLFYPENGNIAATAERTAKYVQEKLGHVQLSLEDRRVKIDSRLRAAEIGFSVEDDHIPLVLAVRPELIGDSGKRRPIEETEIVEREKVTTSLKNIYAVRFRGNMAQLERDVRVAIGFVGDDRSVTVERNPSDQNLLVIRMN